MDEKLQFIEITTDTRTEHGSFYAGEIRKVSPEVAGYLIGNGWAKKHGVTLVVQNVKQPAKAKKAG